MFFKKNKETFLIQRSQNRRVVDWALDKKRQISRDSVREQWWMLGKAGSVYKCGESLYSKLSIDSYN